MVICIRFHFVAMEMVADFRLGPIRFFINVYSLA